MRGAFICIEGIDASGKTVQARRLVKNLRALGYDAIYTTEPSRGAVGRLVKRLILSVERRAPSAMEALLFAADRLDHLQREVMPALAAGGIVVSDRYVHSSLAYQGAAGLDLKWIKEVNRFAIKPDLVIYLDVPPEVVIERIKRKPSVMETLENQRRVRELYLKLVEEGELVLLNGNRPIEEVAKDVLEGALKLLRSLQLEG